MKLILLSLLLLIPAAFAAPPKLHTVDADGHPIAVWEKSVKNPKGHILLHHGRTWSSLPDFDLQVEGEDLSLMDGFNKMGYSVWAMDAQSFSNFCVETRALTLAVVTPCSTLTLTTLCSRT